MSRFAEDVDECLTDVTVIIPAHNEESSIGRVLEDLPQVGCVIVVNNDSSDATAEIAGEAGASVVDEPRRGYGQACLAGLAAIEESIASGVESPQIVVFLDGDYSDDPRRLTSIVEPIRKGESTLCLGPDRWDNASAVR